MAVIILNTATATAAVAGHRVLVHCTYIACK